MAQTTIRGSQIENSYAFKAYLTSDTSTFSAGSTNQIPFNAEEMDRGSAFNTSTHQFTAQVAGDYQFNLQVLNSGTSGSVYQIGIYLNSSLKSEHRIWQQGSWTSGGCSDLLPLAVDDVVEAKIVVPSGVTSVVKATSYRTWLSGYLVRRT